jgi:hypothetical protein
MTHWQDPITVPPTPQVAVWLHRVPPDSPPFWGVLDMLVAHSYVCGPNNWTIPAFLIFRWKAISSGTNPPGLPPIDHYGWRDPLFYPPAANQACWVRRLPFDTPPLRCTWNDTSECFSTDTEALEIDIPWFNVLKWRPRGS